MFDQVVHRDRLDAARAAAEAVGMDALLVTPGPNLWYLTGYAPLPLERLTCLVVPANAPPTLVVPTLELPAARATIGEACALAPWGETVDPYALVADVVAASARPAAVGVDERMWARHVLALRDALPGVEQLSAVPVLSGLRVRKSDVEIEALAEAGEAIDRVHAQMWTWLRPGRTEAEVARDIAAAIVVEGHVAADFVIVGAGPHSASPHHEPTDRPIGTGEPVVVDIGGTTSRRYHSDATRTYVLGAPPAEFAEYYAVLLAAQEAGVRAVRPGVTAQVVDAACRDVITAAGHAEHFIHRTGHGIGVETHEEPYLVAGNSQVLEPGMTFSVEPGIYLPGRHGARIEDIVVCVEGGVRRLNHRPRELACL